MKTHTTGGMFRRCAVGCLLVGPLVLHAGPGSAATQVDWWHAFTGRLGELLNEQVKAFNSSQSEYVVVATNKGNCSETHGCRSTC